MQYLAICQQCRFAFALPSPMDSAICPKPGCGGEALVSDGSYGSAFRILHEAFPMAMPRTQRREIQKLLRRLIAGKITPAEAIDDEALSSETVGILKLLASIGFPALSIILTLFMMLQNQAHHEESRQDQAESNEDQRRFLETLAENLEHLHQNDAELAARLSRVGEAELVDIEPEQSSAPRRRRAESENAPKPQSRRPPTTRKKKKGEKRP